MTDQLTRRQQAILDAVTNGILYEGAAPTYQQLCRIVGLSSTSAVSHQVEQLVAKGLLEWVPGRRVLRFPVDPDSRPFFRVGRQDVTHHWNYEPGGDRGFNHCPVCGANCQVVGITKLAYTFETCSCGSPEYDHLVEQLWHRTCLTKGTP